MLEYVAVVLLTAMLLAAVVLAVPGTVTGALERAVCAALGLDDCDRSRRAADERYEPERCLRSRATEVAGGEVEVIVSVGEQVSFVTERFSDGRTQLTLVDSSRLEASLGLGGGVNLGKALRLGASLDVTGSVSLPNGSTWILGSPEEAQRLREDLRTRQKIDATRRISPLIGWGVDKIWGPDIPPPDITRQGVESSLGAEARTGAGLGNEDDDRPGKGSGRGIEGWDISPQLHAHGAVGVTAVLSRAENRRDGTVMTVYELGGTAQVGAHWVVDRVRPTVGRSGTMTVVQDTEGRVVSLLLAQTARTPDGPTVTTTHLKVDTDEKRRMVAEWLGLVADDQVIPLTWDSMAPTELAPDASPFERWVFEEGRTTRARYDYDNDVRDVSASLKVGVSLGLGGTWGGESLDIVEAEYLGAPRDGVRSYTEYGRCA
ncbi:hypothetical protein DEF23_00210 [Marinitenerispora sediminis]|uniref:Uncharacterized protein n=2 Tax=Marinitenerispora sediminis TaxID=1931232 RepID=A0A368T723_9ACTN|nr:hypothetical protein DEF28_00560 [Marinitenerispora sediminis]RCV59706.1 hypothetical protein DEF24_09020 [Marinitenerispora sediminis]RCV62339.1 hypothetical protein DEF23_00210 [Marinitenerispora sediminis]